MDVKRSYLRSYGDNDDIALLEYRFLDFINRIICLPGTERQRRQMHGRCHPKPVARRLKAVYSRLPPDCRLSRQDALCQLVRLMLDDLEPDGGKMGPDGWCRPSLDWLINVHNFLRVVIKLVLRIRRDGQHEKIQGLAQSHPLMGLVQEMESVHV